MNNILKLNGFLHHKPNSATMGPAKIPTGSSIDAQHLQDLIDSLEFVINYWETQNNGLDPLVSIHYSRVIAKSNRVSTIFRFGGQNSNDSIVGAKFSDNINPKHIITHCIPIDILKKTKLYINQCLEILNVEYNGFIDSKLFEQDSMSKSSYQYKTLSKSRFFSLLKDCFFIIRFALPQESIESDIQSSRIITLYKTNLSLDEILKISGLTNEHFRKLDNLTWNLLPVQYAKLYRNAPYLISMSTTDMRNIPSIVSNTEKKHTFSIPKPGIEPTIGVLDTLCSDNTYFSEWVENHCLLSEELIDKEDYYHGTAVTSLIIDGPTLNPDLDDGCGRFKVRHFGIAKQAKNSSVDIVNRIKQIVLENPDIKVWNLSLGSDAETEISSISPEAAILDELQFKHDIVFVISGTNNNDRYKSFPRIGAPADSLNSVVVNSITFDNKPAEYSRSGPVLCFFNKPDICSFGGDNIDQIKVFTKGGLCKVCGTSYAAPWISRKLAFLIHILKFPREIAKALIVDSAAAWNTNSKFQHLLGYGKVPTKISDIITTPNDEIKFYITGTIESYDTYSHNIPIPISKGKYPFLAKATLCYFPECSRNQGVDYTNSELDIHFGRLHNGKIKSIDNNIQGDPECMSLYEEDARKLYRKWDNVKHICERIKPQNGAKKVYEDSKYWGFTIKNRGRLSSSSGTGLHFGLIVTLKEIEGKNRINDFISLCTANNWFVNEIDVNAMIENYTTENEIIEFED